MGKVRLVATATFEYEADPSHYEGCSTPEEMAALDQSGDVWAILDNEKTVFSVKPAD